MTDPIACRELVCVRPSGEAITLTMTVGKPYWSSGITRCPVSLEPSHGPLADIAGVDSWQALQLAMDLIERLLRAEIENGSKLYWREENGTRSEYDLRL
jgi:hypothetical protein